VGSSGAGRRVALRTAMTPIDHLPRYRRDADSRCLGKTLGRGYDTSGTRDVYRPW
jgi:hypothetical protein